jgi:mono/diheme cytochrome c family protein
MSAPARIDRSLLSLAVVLACAFAGSALAQGAPEALGAAIAQRNCSQCHAVGLKGESPNPAAPQFRKLDRRFVVQELDQAALEKLMAHHAGMPRFRTTRRERESLIAYLKSLQAYKEASADKAPLLVPLAAPGPRP